MRHVDARLMHMNLKFMSWSCMPNASIPWMRVQSPSTSRAREFAPRVQDHDVPGDCAAHSHRLHG